jgi:hypothetical protein
MAIRQVRPWQAKHPRVWFHTTHRYYYFRGNPEQPAVVLPGKPGDDDFQAAAKVARNLNRGWERLIAKFAGELTRKPPGMG